jgi:hypothetical protein
MGDWSSAAAGFLGFLHVSAGTLEHIVARLEVIRNPWRQQKTPARGRRGESRLGRCGPAAMQSIRGLLGAGSPGLSVLRAAQMGLSNRKLFRL